jgi:hypothetical protein
MHTRLGVLKERECQDLSVPVQAAWKIEQHAQAALNQLRQQHGC